MIPSLRPPREPYDRYDPTAPGAPRDPTAALRRRVFSVGLPVGIATTVLVWVFERADGLIHAVDLYGIPLVALGLVLAWAALRSGRWRGC